jgi:hypothetical protein
MGYAVGFLVGVMVSSLLLVLSERLGKKGLWQEGRRTDKPAAVGNREAALVGYVAGLLRSDELRESERARFEEWLETTNSAQHPAPTWARMFVVHAAEDLARRASPAVATRAVVRQARKTAA